MNNVTKISFMVLAISCSFLQAGPLINVARKRQIQRDKASAMRSLELQKVRNFERAKLNLRLLELQKVRDFERAKRLNNYVNYLANPTSKEYDKLKRELLNEIKSKIREVADCLFSLDACEEWQKDYWMGRATQSRKKGDEVLAAQYENFVRYKIEQRRNEIQQKSSESKERASR